MSTFKFKSKDSIECKHNWVYKRTRHEKEKCCGTSDIVYRLVDEYYCNNCLEQKEIVTHKEVKRCYMEKPVWYEY